ncbi:NAD(P)-dependent oxidoreductase [Pseudochelatococcus sp. B33]
MSASRIVIAAAIPPELRAVLAADHELVELKRGPEVLPGHDVAVTTSIAGADRALMDQLPDLKLIACNGTGLENIDLDEAARRNIIVRHTPDEVTDDTADFAIALIYATSRRLAEADRFMRAGRWARERMTPSRRAFDRTIGIVGLGKIGRTIARRATALGMTVLYTGPRRKPDVPYEYVPDIGILAQKVSMLVLSCPGGPETHHIVNGDVLRKLGPESTLINVSRGSVVNEDDLLRALEDKAIAGAGLDVFASEPGFDQRFLAFENVVLVPHYAAVTTETRFGIANALAGAIRDLRAGKPVSNAAARNENT